MIRGTVLGQVWATRKAAGLEGRKLSLVAVEASDRLLVCIDTMEAHVGERVLVAFGSGARNVLAPGPDNRRLLCDAAVAQVVDGSSEEG